jgi:hypothetical protein
MSCWGERDGFDADAVGEPLAAAVLMAVDRVKLRSDSLFYDHNQMPSRPLVEHHVLTVKPMDAV